MCHWIATLDSVIASSMVSLSAELSGSYLRRLVTNAQAASARHAFKCMLHELGRYRQLCCVMEREMAQPTLQRSRTCRLALAEESIAEQSRPRHLDDCTLYSGDQSSLAFTHLDQIPSILVIIQTELRRKATCDTARNLAWEFLSGPKSGKFLWAFARFLASVSAQQHHHICRIVARTVKQCLPPQRLPCKRIARWHSRLVVCLCQASPGRFHATWPSSACTLTKIRFVARNSAAWLDIYMQVVTDG